MKEGRIEEGERKERDYEIRIYFNGFFLLLLKIQVSCNLGNKCFHTFFFQTGQLDLFPGIWCQKIDLMSGKLDKIENSVVT